MYCKTLAINYRKIQSMRVACAVFLLLTFALFSVNARAAGLPDFRELARESGHAVVNISTERTVQGSSPFDMFRNSPFEDFFNQFGGNPFSTMPQAPERVVRSLGSGFIISPDGYIVTNHHVIKNADVIMVNLEGTSGAAKSYRAELIGADDEVDLALLKIDAGNSLPYTRFGDSDRLEVGEWVLAIGNPFGLDHTVTSGIISAKGRNIGSGPFDNYIQTDASINPGNSGGPLINMRGEVIGINTAIIAQGQGIGFAIPARMAERIIEQLRDTGRVQRGWMGVSIQDVDDNTAKALNLGDQRGALIGTVFSGGPAEQAGLLPGDVIVKLNDDTVQDSSQLLRGIAGMMPGDKARLTVWRNNRTQVFRVTLADRGTESAAMQQNTPQQQAAAPESVALGLHMRPVTDKDAASLRMPAAGGLLVTDVDGKSAAAEAGLRKNDVILQVNMKAVNSPENFTEILQREGRERGALVLQVFRNGQSFFLSVPVE